MSKLKTHDNRVTIPQITPAELVFLDRGLLPQKFIDHLSKEIYRDVHQTVRKHVLDAIDAFIQHKYSKFDALVGDNACQIRALQIALLARTDIYSELFMIRNRLMESKARVPETLSVSQDALRVCQFYMLSLRQSGKIGRTANINGIITEAFPISGNTAKFIVKHLRKAVFADSLNYVKTIALEVSQPLRDVILRYSYETPYYYMSEVIFLKSVKEKVPILLKLRNGKPEGFGTSNYVSSWVFESDGQIGYTLSEASDCDSAQPCIVIEGWSELPDRILANGEGIRTILEIGGGLLPVIGLNCAQHSQFPVHHDPLNFASEIIAEEADVVARLASKAKRLGFSLENGSLLCLEHIFCDSIYNQLVG